MITESYNIVSRSADNPSNSRDFVTISSGCRKPESSWN
jgi:hypothetical protein